MPKGKRVMSKSKLPKRAVHAKTLSESDSVSFLKFIIFAVTLLILFTPLIIEGQSFFPFIAPKSIYFIALTLILSFSYALLALKDPNYRPKINIMLLAITLFTVVMIISALTGVNLSKSFWSDYERMTGILMWLHLIAFFVVLSSVFRKWEDWKKIFSVSVFAGIVISAISLYMIYDPNFLGQIGSFSPRGSTIGNTSFLGTYLIFNIFIALYLFFKTEGYLKIYAGLSFLFITAVLLTTDARASIVALAGGLFVLLCLWLILKNKGFIRIAGVILLVLTAAASLVTVRLVFLPGSFIRTTLERMNFAPRFVVWERSVTGWLERPLLGWGPENFDVMFEKHFNPVLFLPEYGQEIWFDRAHNIIIDTLVTVGIVGLLAYLGIFAAVLFILWQNYRKEKTCFWTAAVFSSLLAAYFVQNLTVFDKISSYMIFFLILSFTAGQIAHDVKKSQLKLNPYIHYAAIFALFVFFGTAFYYFAIQPLRVTNLIVETLAIPPASLQRQGMYRRTLNTSFIGKEQIRIFFAENAIDFAASGQEVNLNEMKSNIEFLAAELEKTLEEAPLDYRAQITLGRLYANYGILGENMLIKAEQVLRNAMGISPNNPHSHWVLAQVLMMRDDFNAALTILEEAAQMEPRIENTHTNIIRAAMFKGDLDFATEKAKRAIEINPEWRASIEQILGKEIR